MKNREFLETVANGTINDEVVEFAKAEIEKIDAANAKRRENPTKATLAKRAANEELKGKVLGVLTENPIVVADIIAAIGEDVTAQRINYVAHQLVDEGKAEAVDVKVPTKGTQRGYKLVG